LELGAGPGLMKQRWPEVIASDLAPQHWLDLACDGCRLPFQDGTLGAIVMLDVIHHLPEPLNFLSEAARVLRPGGRLVAIEPWITPASWVLYRYFHHEDCELGVDLAAPFRSTRKPAYEGNAAIPFQLTRIAGQGPMRLVESQPFLGLEYLATLGFQRRKPVPRAMLRGAAALERLLGPLGRWNATRALLVWERA
jgi:SAM-dependent methyltransferase